MSIVMGELVNTEEEPQIIRRTEDTWLVDGATPLADVMRALDIEAFPNSENYETNRRLHDVIPCAKSPSAPIFWCTAATNLKSSTPKTSKSTSFW